MRGSYDFKVAKSASNSQGEGFSYDFSIKTPDKNKKLKIQFDLNSSDSNYTAGDVLVYVYDVTNATLITPSSTSLPKFGPGTHQITFDSTSSTSYRLIFHWAVTTATAVNLYFDNIVVGPGEVVQGAAVGRVSPTFTYEGMTPAIRFDSHREVNWLTTRGWFDETGASGTTAAIVLPSGYTIDTSILSTGGCVVGEWYREYSGASAYLEPEQGLAGIIFYDGSTTNKLFFGYRAGAGVFEKLTGNNVINGDDGSIYFSIPIAEWAGTVSTGPAPAEEYVSYYDAAATTANTTFSDQTKVSRSPLGSQYASVASTSSGTSTTYEMNLQYPYQLDDELILETSSDSGATFQPQLGLINGVSVLHQVGGNLYGLNLQGNAGSTKVRLSIGNYGRVANNASYAGTGAPWVDVAGGVYRWRIRKTKKASLPYANAGTDGSAGLYKAGQAPGYTGSTAISSFSSGYIGQEISSSLGRNSAASLSSGNHFQVGSAQVVLTTGIWILTGNIGFTGVGTLSQWRGGYNTSNVALTGTEYDLGYATAGAGSNACANQDLLIPLPTRIVQITAASQTFYLMGFATFTSTLASYGQIRAIRIA